jgi:hypothetical protein
MGAGVAQRTQTVEKFLTWRLPKLQIQLVSIDLDVGVVSCYRLVRRLYIRLVSYQAYLAPTAERAAETGKVVDGRRTKPRMCNDIHGKSHTTRQSINNSLNEDVSQHPAS